MEPNKELSKPYDGYELTGFDYLTLKSIDVENNTFGEDKVTFLFTDGSKLELVSDGHISWNKIRKSVKSNEKDDTDVWQDEEREERTDR